MEGDPKRAAMNISHLFFVGDILVFCKAKQNQICAMRALLLCFDVALGLKVNFDT